MLYLLSYVVLSNKCWLLVVVIVVNPVQLQYYSRVQNKNQEEFKTQEESLESRIKIQGSRSQESISRFKTQDSRMKRRLNQDK